MDVYWSPIIMKPVFTGEGMSHLRVPEPTLASNILKGTFDENNRSSNFMKCPSFNKQQKNVYALKFGYTYGFEINKGNVKTEFYDQSFFNDTILLRDPKNKILSLGRMGYIFISETSLEMDFTGAYLDNNDFVNKTTVIPGSFDIGKWFRPLELSFIIKNDPSKIKYSEGDTYAYVNFKTEKKIKLKKFHITPEINLIIEHISSTKNNKLNQVNGLSWFYDLLDKSKYKNKMLKLVKENIL